MRRHENEMTSREDIEAVIRRARVCRLGLAEDNRPYVVPLCFGYEDGALFFHSATQGRKLDILRKNPHVCFEFDVDQEVVEGDSACQWGMKYRSVVGFGKAELVQDSALVRHAFDVIMRQYSDGSFTYPEKSLSSTAVIRVDIEGMTGKQSGYPQ